MNLHRLLLVIKARAWWILATLALVMLVAEVVTRMIPPTYSARADLIIDFNEPPESDATLAPQLQADYLATQVAIIKGRSVAARVVDALDLTSNPDLQAAFQQSPHNSGFFRDWLIDVLLSNAFAYVRRDTRLVTVGYAAGQAEVAALYANAFAEAYRALNLELMVGPARRSAEWIDSQLVELREQLESAQRSLSEYQRDTGVVLTDERMDVENAHLSELTKQLAASQAQLEAAEGQIRQLDSMLAAGADLETLPEILGNPYVQSLKSELRRKEIELADLSTQFGRRHPEYRRTVSELNALKTRLDAEILAVVEAVRVEAKLAGERNAALQQSQAEQRAKLLEIRQNYDKLMPLIQEVESARQNYNDALENAQRYQLQSRLNQTNVTILNDAVVPTTPSSPDKMQNRLVAFLVGLMLAIGIVVIADLRNRKIREVKDAERATDAPVLGALPRP